MKCNGLNFFITHSLLTLRFQFSKRPWLSSSVSHSLPLKNVYKNYIWGGVEDTLLRHLQDFSNERQFINASGKSLIFHSYFHKLETRNANDFSA